MRQLIKVEALHFSYEAQQKILNGVSFNLSEKERLCINGGNGVGKSTLLRLLVGLHKPDAGQIIAFDHIRFSEKDFHEVRRRAGLVFQDPDDQLFCPTVAEDIAFGPMNLGKSKAKVLLIVDQVLTQLGINHLRDRITHKLSGGEKRLVTLAAVLAMEPEILLLDEPTNAVDEEGKEMLIDILQQLPQAMIIISHDTCFRNEISTRHLWLKEGKIYPQK